MSKILCLANSSKESARCIAGLDLKTHRLVRLVSRTKSQAIPEQWATIDGKLVAPLDVIDVPFVRGNAVVPFQSENRYCNEGWEHIGRLQPSDIRRFCEPTPSVLGTSDSDAIRERFFKLNPRGKSGWKSLQLIHAPAVRFHQEKGKWLGQFRTGDGREYDLRVTDERSTGTLDGDTERGCALLLSLTRPWRHYCAPKSKPKKCYKLIAGVIPL